MTCFLDAACHLPSNYPFKHPSVCQAVCRWSTHFNPHRSVPERSPFLFLSFSGGLVWLAPQISISWDPSALLLSVTPMPFWLIETENSWEVSLIWCYSTPALHSTGSKELAICTPCSARQSRRLLKLFILSELFRAPSGPRFPSFSQFCFNLKS